MKEIKHAKNMYSLCSSSECTEDCIYFEEDELKCHIGEDLGIYDEISSFKFMGYLKTLKKAYKRYKEYSSKSYQEGDKQFYEYWKGMADCIQGIFNDLGIGYYL